MLNFKFVCVDQIHALLHGSVLCVDEVVMSESLVQ